MKDIKNLAKAFVLILVVLFIPLTIVFTIKLHQQQQLKVEYSQQQSAVILLTEIESDYYTLHDMLEFYCETINAPAIQRELDKDNLEKASYLFIRAGVNRKNLSSQFAWTFINQRYEILHKNIENYNNRTSGVASKINDIDDIPRVISKFKGRI